MPQIDLGLILVTFGAIAAGAALAVFAGAASARIFFHASRAQDEERKVR